GRTLLIWDTTHTRGRPRCAWLALMAFALIGIGGAASACNTSAGQTDAAGGRGGGRGGRGGGQAIRVETSALQHISLERRVDLSGTLVSPDQARVSSEVAGVIREVRIQLGSEVRVGDVLVRLEPRELALALERAESALRQV